MMDPERLLTILEQVRERKLSVGEAARQFRHLPFEDLGFAKVDHHRALRQGFPEVVLGQGKEPREIAAIVKALQRHKNNVLVTRVTAVKMAVLKRLAGGLKYHAAAHAATWIPRPIKITGKGTVLVVCAGTSDIPVGEEAAITATIMGNRVEKL